jgi:predicted metal-dependent HD superfamily phosphohydrolase
MWCSLTAGRENERLFDELTARYSEPHRKYHTLQHLDECIALFESAAELAQHPAEVEAALWFHDAVYEVRGHDNEARSATWAKRALLDAGAADDAAARVEALVLATRHTALPEPGDQQLLVDIDLAILGAPQARFAEYERQIREEYAHVPGPLFGRKRRAILQGFLDRSRIYSTEHFHARLEALARANLRGAISRRAL